MNKSHYMIPFGSKRSPLTLSIGALMLGLACTGPARAVDLVTNGDFSADAAAFVSGNGYFSEGSNPASVQNWTTTGSGMNGTATTTSNAFAPATNVPSFLFMQGDKTAAQAISTVNATDYLFSFDAAARNGNTAGVSVFADNTQAASVVIDGNLGWLPSNAFQRYAFGFTATTNGQTIQFNSSGLGDHTTDITNVSVAAAAVSGVWDIANNTAFFTETSGTRNYGFSLTGNNQTIIRRPGSATYTGNITTDGSAGALTFIAYEDAGVNNLTFSGSTIALGPKNFVVSGFTVDGEDQAANTKVTLNNVALTTGGNVEVGRGTLELTGNTSLGIGGQLRSGVNGDWSRFVMGAGTSVSAPGGVDFRANGVIASSLYLNGGTLTTSSITGNDYSDVTHTVFNGTTVVASASSADFLDVRFGVGGAAHSSAALVGNGGAIFNTNGNNITISNTLANLGGNSGSLTKQGNGTLTLTTTSTYTGSTTVSGGTLLLGGNATPVSVTVLNAGFENTGSLGGGGWAYAPTGADWSFVGGTGISSNNQPWVNTAPEGTHAGYIQNSSFSQVLNFASSTTYDITFQAANRPGYNPTGLLLQVDGITVSHLSAQGFQNGAAFGQYRFAGVSISAGNHTIAFVGNNTIGGDTATAIDAISISSTVSALPSGTALSLTAAGAVVDLNGHNQTVGSLAGVAGTTVQNIASFTVGGDGTSTSYAGAISGSGSLTKVGAGSLTLSGALNFPTLTASQGVTNLNSALGTGTSTINANATVNINASQTLAALNIADGVEVTFGDGLPFAWGPGKFGAAGVVPEPGSAALLVGGFAALLGLRRRRA